jgi:hypothetical protein
MAQQIQVHLMNKELIRLAEFNFVGDTQKNLRRHGGMKHPS